MKTLFGLSPVQLLGFVAGFPAAHAQPPTHPQRIAEGAGGAPNGHRWLARQSACLGGGSEQAINAKLRAGGDNAKVALCPGSNFALQAPVVFSARGQSVYTAGYPTGADRATLKVTGKQQTMAVQGDCGTCFDISLRNVVVDGSRPTLGRLDPGAALIEFGGPTSGQTIDHVHAFEPRAWSTIHVIEGLLNCANAKVTNNQIGPAGNFANAEWADGISMACTNSLVANNTITDTTDGAIVLFGAPGTLVENNQIRALTRTALGGINLVDYGPYSGNYAGTTVRGNTLEAQAYLRVGVAIGPQVWGDDTTRTIRGATVTGNTFLGPQLGYGIAVAGASGITVEDNVSKATYSGKLGDNCHRPLNAAPGPFTFVASRTQGKLQAQFVDGRLQYVICVAPGLSTALNFNRGQLNLAPGQQISLEGARLGVTEAGAIVVKNGGGRTVWSSRTARQGTAPLRLTLNNRGRLNLATADATVAEYPVSGVSPGHDATLTFANAAPYLLLKTAAGSTAWASSYTFPEFKLSLGQYVAQTTGPKPYYLQLEADANLRVRRGSPRGTEVWSSKVTGKRCGDDCFSVLQDDGNLVTYSGGKAVWASGTNGKAFAVAGLALQTQAPFVRLTDAKGATVWRAN